MNSLSIIIPTLNEVNNIKRTISALRDRACLDCEKQIIVVDSGSTDGTLDVVRQLNVALIKQPQAPKGRAYLLNRGAQAAKGDVLLFCDADSIVPKGYDQSILQTMRKKRVVGGAFEFKLDGPQFGLRVVEVINRIRYRLWKRYYGDQGIFVSKQVFHKAGGYPQVGLMEASEFCITLARYGRLALVKKPMLTSARRFVDNGIYRMLAHDIKLWWLNHIGRDVESFSQSYWQFNEMRGCVK